MCEGERKRVIERERCCVYERERKRVIERERVVCVREIERKREGCV